MLLPCLCSSFILKVSCAGMICHAGLLSPAGGSVKSEGWDPAIMGLTRSHPEMPSSQCPAYAMHDSVIICLQETFKKEGLDYTMDGLTGNTEQGCDIQDRVVEELFKAYFTQARLPLRSPYGSGCICALQSLPCMPCELHRSAERAATRGF